MVIKNTEMNESERLEALRHIQEHDLAFKLFDHYFQRDTISIAKIKKINNIIENLEQQLKDKK